MNKPIVPINTLLDGYKKSYLRYKVAKNQKDPQIIFLPLFEVLNWTACIDSRLQNELGRNWQKTFIGVGEIVEGVRYARNRVHHQWADILHVTNGASFPIELPAAFYEWSWNKLIDLPLEDNRHLDNKGKQSYISLLENRSVRFAFSALDLLFEKVATKINQAV